MQVVDLGNGIMRFEFNQIWLPDSTTNEPESHGHLSYRINEIPTNAIMSIIENTAYIYFDWNEAIVTNTTFHQNMWIDGIDELKNQLEIRPNPAQTTIQIELTHPQNVKILNLNGQILMDQEIFPGEHMDIQYLKPGLYMVQTEGKCSKFIKN